MDYWFTDSFFASSCFKLNHSYAHDVAEENAIVVILSSISGETPEGGEKNGDNFGGGLGLQIGYSFRSSIREGWQSGTVVVVGTDGIREARNVRNELFGTERLVAAVRRSAECDASGIRRAIIDAYRAFQRDMDQEDDATVVVVKLG